MLTDEQIQERYIKGPGDMLESDWKALCDQAKAANRMEKALRDIADSTGDGLTAAIAEAALRGEAR